MPDPTTSPPTRREFLALTATALAELTGTSAAPSLIVADLSFISLTLVFPAIADIAEDGAELILLIKPQFEVGRGGIREGIVTDPALADAAVQRVLEAARRHGLRSRGLTPSPLTGEHGNREFLAYFERVDRASCEPTSATVARPGRGTGA